MRRARGLALSSATLSFEYCAAMAHQITAQHGTSVERARCQPASLGDELDRRVDLDHLANSLSHGSGWLGTVLDRLAAS